MSSPTTTHCYQCLEPAIYLCDLCAARLCREHALTIAVDEAVCGSCYTSPYATALKHLLEAQRRNAIM